MRTLSKFLSELTENELKDAYTDYLYLLEHGTVTSDSPLSRIKRELRDNYDVHSSGVAFVAMLVFSEFARRKYENE